MKPAVMIDLETLGKAPGCAIASIGAVKFDPYSDWMGDIFHVHVDLKSCEASGLKIDADTVLWWLQQDVDARDVLINGQREAARSSQQGLSISWCPKKMCACATLYTALDAFTGFYADSEAIWCNGASFDYPILSAAYAAIRENAPWQFWQEHDLRTLKNLNKGARLARLGTHHSAMDDAIHQARLVQHILQYNPDMDA